MVGLLLLRRLFVSVICILIQDISLRTALEETYGNNFSEGFLLTVRSRRMINRP